ncbi:MAG: PfkB family carbohydrate kinase [bacterium]|nr:PfkB family carbohydrate kinase [bacterium]
MQKRPLVVGSVAIDILFDIHGTIQEKIVLVDGKLGGQNLMFTAGMKEERYGGTGGNIAYGLGLLGAKPILFASAGPDFENLFRRHLVKKGIDVRVYVDPSNWTATFYGMSDRQKEQIGIWQPNAHANLGRAPLLETVSETELKKVSVAIFSGHPALLYPHMQKVRKLLGKKVQMIFDPGKMITLEDRRVLERGMRLADIFIVNEVELHQAHKTLNRTTEEIFDFGIKAIIETRGETGSIIYQKGSPATVIPAVKAKKVVETTGAGDAYRAGLIHGLLKGKTLRESCELGAKIAAKSVAFRGAQTYRL